MDKGTRGSTHQLTDAPTHQLTDSTKRNNKMLLGCNTVVFAGGDLAAALEAIAWAGYRYVELAAIKGMCEHVRSDGDAAHLAEIRSLLEAYNLQATAIEAASTDPTRLGQIFGLASELGITIVNIGSGGTSGDEASTQEAIAHLGRLARLAGEHGLKLAVKPHVGQAIYNSATALRLLDEVREPALGLNFDPSHLYRANEDPPAVARRWAGRIVTSHFRDCASREQRVGPPETQIPGRGSIDLPATLAALHEQGYAGPLNLEVIGTANYGAVQAMGIAAEARGYLHRCLQELVLLGKN
jgi:sugar phosphate isomerase/epimerase